MQLWQAVYGVLPEDCSLRSTYFFPLFEFTGEKCWESYRISSRWPFEGLLEAVSELVRTRRACRVGERDQDLQLPLHLYLQYH